jgi:DNA-binding beta-propeller fold protein YncE
MRRRDSLAFLLLLVIAGVAITWYMRRPAAPGQTEGTWTAMVTTIAGLGVPGLADGATPLARFSDPFAVAVGRDGRIYVADGGDSNGIRRLDEDAVATIAGSGEGFEDGPPARARFNTPSGIAVAADGAVYVADTGNHRIRRIAPDGQVTTVAGSGVAGLRDGRGRDAQLNGPIGLAIAASVVPTPRHGWTDDLFARFRASGPGTDLQPAPVRLLIVDTYNDAVRLVDADGIVTTIAGGSGPGFRDGRGPLAQFDTPCGITALADGTMIVADTGNDTLRRVTRDGDVTTLTLRPIDANSDVSLFRPVGISSAPWGSTATPVGL